MTSFSSTSCAWDAGRDGTARPVRPATVTAAFVLLLLASALMLLPAVAAGYDLAHILEVTQRAAATAPTDKLELIWARNVHRAVDLVVIVLCVPGSLSLILSGVWMRGGSNLGRITACVLAALWGLCCAGLAFALLTPYQWAGGELEREISRLTQQETPTWVQLLDAATAIVPPLTIVVVLLLLLPPSNRFFCPPSPLAVQVGPYAVYYAFPRSAVTHGPGRGR